MLRGKRILVVEDEALVAMMLEDTFLDAGAEVKIAATVSEALRLLNEGPVDAAVLDCGLAGEPVMPVADRAAALGVPFLFATGYGEKCEKGSHTAVPVLSKPYEPAKVVSTIAGFFRDRE